MFRKKNLLNGSQLFMHKILKIILITFGIFIGLILIALIGIRIYIGTDAGQAFVRSKINNTLQGELQWEAMDLSLLDGRIELKDLLLTGPDGAEITGLDRLFLDVSLGALFGGDLVIESVILEKPWAHLKVDEDGNLNLQEALPKPGPEAPPPEEEKKKGGQGNIIIKEARIIDGRFLFEDAGTNMEARLDGIGLAADFNLGRKSGQIQADIEKGSFQSPEMEADLEKFVAEGTLTDGLLDPLVLRIKTTPLNADLTGTVAQLFSPDPQLDIDLDLALSLPEIRNLLTLEPEMTGDVTLALTAKGSASDPEAKLRLAYGGGTLADVSVASVLLTASLKDRVLDIETLSVDSEALELSADGRADLTRVFADGFLSPPTDLDALSYRLRLENAQADLSKIPAGPEKMTGTVRAALNLSGEGIRPEGMNTALQLSVSGQGIAVGDFKSPMGLDLDAEAAVNEGVAEIKKVDVRAGDVRLSAYGDLDLSTDEIKAFLELNAPKLGETLANFGIKGITGDAAFQTDIEGTLKQPAFDMRLSGDSLGYTDYTIGDVRLNAWLSPAGLLTINTLSVQNQGSSLTGEGKIALFGKDFKIEERVPVDFTATLTDVQPEDFLQKEIAKGTLNGNLTLSGTLKDIEAQLLLNGENLAFKETRIGDVALDADLVEDTLYLNDLSVENRNSELTASGTVGIFKPGTREPLENPTLDIEVTSDEIRLSDFNPKAFGSLSLDADLSGSTKKPIMDLSLSGTRLKWDTYTIGNLNLEAELSESGILSVSTLNLTNQGSQIQGQGTLQPFDPAIPIDFTAQLSNVEATDFLQKEIAKGTLNGTLTAGGSVKVPRVELDLKGRDLAAQGYRLGNLDTQLTLIDGKLDIANLSVKNRESALNITGTAQVLDPKTLKPLDAPVLDFEIDSEGIYLQDFTDQFKGRFVLDAALKGTPKEPQGKIELRGNDIDLGVQSLESVTLMADLNGQRVRFEPLRITIAENETITGTGWYSIDRGAYDIELHSDPIALKNIEKVKAMGFAAGNFQIDLSGKGTVKSPNLSGNITATDLRFKGKPLDDIRLQVNVADNLAKVNGRLNFGIDGTYNLETNAFTASASFDRTILDPYFEIADRPELSGTLTGTVQAQGNANNVKGIQANADFSNLDLNFEDTDLLSASNLRFTFENGVLKIPENRLRLLEEGNLVIGGQVDTGGPLSLSINGDIPAHAGVAFSDAVPELSGGLSLSASIRGTMKQPDIEADLNLNDLGMVIPEIEQQIRNLNGRIHITPKSLELKNVRGEFGTGEFTITGNAALKDFQPGAVDFRLTAETLPVGIPETLDLLFNIQLSFTGNLEETATLAGEVTLLEGLYYKDIRLSPLKMLRSVGNRSRETEPVKIEPKRKESAGGPNLLNRIELDIVIKSRRPFVVDNNILYIEIRPDFKVTGNLNQPLIDGRAGIGTGTVSYQGRSFEVTRGVIDFIDPYQIRPNIDIQAVSNVRKWSITMTITGTPDALKVDFDSEPPLEDSEIISLLIFGRTPDELIQGEGGTSKAPAQAVSEIVSQTVGEDLKKATGLDILEMEVNDEGEGAGAGAAGGDSGVKVTLGKELSRRMAVKYSVESRDGEVVRRTSAEYKLLENLLINAFQDSKGNIGGELQFRLEFR